MKKIAFVFDGLGVGGIERVGTDYIRMCIEMGYSVDVYNLNPMENSFVSLLPKETKYYEYKLNRNNCPETYSYGVQKWWWGKYAYAIISPALSIVQIMQKTTRERKKYDVAIAISGHINDLSFVAKDYIYADKKICWCHGNIISYLSICDAYPVLYKKMDVLVTLSSAAQKDIYAGKKFLYEKTIKKIYNPTFINTREIDQSKVAFLKSEYGDYVLSVARFEPGKGQDVAIKSMKRLKEKGIDKKILFAGDGTTIDTMRQLAIDEKMSDNCVFLGNCDDVQNYIEASYVNLLTSKWEGLPTVIIEAMAMGKPCIMTNSDDGEVSNNGEYCYLNEVDDIEGITENLYKLYTNNELYVNYVRLSLKRAEAFEPDTIRNQLASIIEN